MDLAIVNNNSLNIYDFYMEKRLKIGSLVLLGDKTLSINKYCYKVYNLNGELKNDRWWYVESRFDIIKKNVDINNLDNEEIENLIMAHSI